MRFGRFRTGALGAALLAVVGVHFTAAAAVGEDRPQLSEPVYRVSKETAAPTSSEPAVGVADAVEVRQARASAGEPPVSREQASVAVEPMAGQPQAAQEHPLMPAIRLARAGLATIDADVKDYTCKLVKREEIDGEILPHQYIYVKVRHEPFSVYMYFLGPAEVRGRECIYVQGANDNRLIAHDGGKRLLLPTVRLDPNGRLAMSGQRYPITEVGVRNLTSRLIEVAEADSKYGECDVKFYKGAKINGRKCTCIQVKHPVPRDNFRFHLAQIFIDDEYQMPIRYAAYTWPREKGKKPTLQEEYTYMDLKINQGLTDEDFDENNPDYNFH